MKLVRRVGPDGLRQSGIAVATSLKASLVETRSSLSSSLTAGPTTAIDEIKRTAKLIAAPGLGRQLHQTLLDPFTNMAVGMGVAASMATREQHKLSLHSGLASSLHSCLHNCPLSRLGITNAFG